MGYLLAFIGGMLVGIIASCVLLAQKNLQKAQRIENQISTNFNAAKAVYKAYVDEDTSESETDENNLEEKD